MSKAKAYAITGAISLVVMALIHWADMHFYQMGLKDGCEAEVYTEFVMDYQLEINETLPPETDKMLHEDAVKVCEIHARHKGDK